MSMLSTNILGTGPQFGNRDPTGIATEIDGRILLNESTLNAVMTVDPVTGNRTILSDATHGTGPTITAPQGILVVPSIRTLLNRTADHRSNWLSCCGSTLWPQFKRSQRMNSKIGFLLAGLLPAFTAFPHLARAAALAPGDVVISTQIGPAANNDHGLVVVDPVTGNRTIVSDNNIGTGPDFTNPTGVAIEPDGSLLVSDLEGISGTIFRVDPTTGDRTVVSSSSDFYYPYGIVETGGTIYVATSGLGAILAVNPLTGSDHVFSGGPGNIGPGPKLLQPVGLAVQGNNLLVADYSSQVFEVNLSTGNRVNFHFNTNSSNDPTHPIGITVSPSGTIFLSSQNAAFFPLNVPGVFTIDPLTQSYSLVSGGALGTGPTMSNTGPAGIATEANGTILLSEATLNAVLSIDPNMGNRTILSDATHGTGPTITAPDGLLVIPPVPEPSSIALLAIGAIGLATMARRHPRR